MAMFHMTSATCRLPKIGILVRAGAPVDAKDCRSNTPLILAMLQRYVPDPLVSHVATKRHQLYWAWDYLMIQPRTGTIYEPD